MLKRGEQWSSTNKLSCGKVHWNPDLRGNVCKVRANEFD
jgi:hypothetical protein